MIKFTANQIRKMWLDFFDSKNHYQLLPASLIPVNDSSLLWINSGVATLKPYFNGKKIPPFSRLTNSQKSIRTNDIENVGYTSHHHTFFEMLGNFSIGDYFKKEAILYAWEFLTCKKWMGFDSTKLYVTIYKEDTESYNIWHNLIGLNNNQIIKKDKNTNFWEIGEGPCGPNTEIFYDRGKKYDFKQIGLKLLKENFENDRYLEIWNIVFSQYNNNGNGTYSDLPQKNIDAGAGLERIASIVQKKITNFETDLFMPIIKNIEKLVNNNNYCYSQKLLVADNDKKQFKINVAFKIISDHLRTIIFAIADGVFPSNKERGYVIRRLIRRSIIYGKKIGLYQPFLFKLVQVVINIMQEYYFYLIEKKIIIEKIILDEEKKFLKTLKQGNVIFNNIKNKFGIISKEHAFFLFESYGLPIELIEEEAQKFKIKVDRIGFNKLLENNKNISRINQKNDKIINLQNKLLIKLDVINKFVGYDCEQVDNTEVIFLFVNNKSVIKLVNSTGYIILKKTPFYAEKGGQVSDKGVILKNNVVIAYVLDVQEGPNKQYLHFVKVEGILQKGDLVKASIDSERRSYIKKNHSGTHLIHAALRNVLGTHIMQIGSFNDDKKLRIDITYNKKINDTEIEKIESFVTKIINSSINCEVIYTDIKTALENYNALAYFAEKYESEVRVVKFGNYSSELCGGTHVNNSQDIEDMLIVNIESKGVGIIRINAIVSNKIITDYLNFQFSKEKTEAIYYFNKYNKEKKKLFDKEFEETWTKINSLNISKKNWILLKKLVIKLKKIFKCWQKKYNNILIQKFIKKYNIFTPKIKNNVNIITHKFMLKINVSFLKILIDDYKSRYSNILIFFIIINENKSTLVIGVSNDLLYCYKADDIIRHLNPILEGKGGGNNNIAQSNFINKKDIVFKLFSDPLKFLKYNE